MGWGQAGEGGEGRQVGVGVVMGEEVVGWGWWGMHSGGNGHGWDSFSSEEGLNRMCPHPLFPVGWFTPREMVRFDPHTTIPSVRPSVRLVRHTLLSHARINLPKPINQSQINQPNMLLYRLGKQKRLAQKK